MALWWAWTVNPTGVLTLTTQGDSTTMILLSALIQRSLVI